MDWLLFLPKLVAEATPEWILDAPLAMAGLPTTDLCRTYVVAAVMVVVAGQVAYSLRTSSVRRRGSCVVLLGESGTGKTTLFQVAVAGGDSSALRKCHTSMEENRGLLPLEWLNAQSTAGPAAPSARRYTFRAALPVLDLPGHPSLRYKLHQAVSSAAAVVFVVDAVAAADAKVLRVTAEHLFTVMKEPAMVANATPLLVFCNKADVPSACSPLALENALADEISTLIDMHTSRLEDTDGEDPDAAAQAAALAALRPPSARFDFAAVPYTVRFTAGAALTGQGVDDLREFVSHAFAQ
ncbi:signal recognition particle receptor beta subunit [Thecamonas trahens ATCC 50062]|uniref:Signal recognition particle receptor subunit beta n=1 Tax=Thecamonas trahens ATCC 50062 TaxID=461836 RepID=A0A0L0DKH6_THETB|nr:signal recognition particle receptor beta subunit [Thecamonas trahens ATCC 50062]KNC52792.1 signal recognition particle receptor beta subunit [Thecamonas trahens ATCC 50062]|eukprot:XP_013755102.1 signal recognition particle receptor beta subunit [Thecamonas trahens ATCC 50062]